MLTHFRPDAIQTIVDTRAALPAPVPIGRRDGLDTRYNDAYDGLVQLTGMYEALTIEQELALLALSPDEAEDPERLVDAVLGAVDLPAELIHPRWRGLAA